MSIKRFFSMLTAFVFLLTSFSLSEAIFTGGGIEVVSESEQETVLTADIGLAGSELQGVNVRFCNNGLEDLTEKISGTLGQMEKGEICVVAKNDSPNNVKVNLSFFSTSVTDAGHTACNQTMENTFGSFMDKQSIQVDVPSGDYIVQKFNIQFPLGVNGKQGGCLFYNVEKENTSDNMVNIVVGKAMFLDYFVGDVGEITKDIKLTIIKKEIVNNELIVQVGAKNKGNIDLNTEVFGSLTNIFGIKKDFALSGEVVRVNNSLVFTLNFGQLPNYKGLFNLDIKAKYAAHFDFDVSKFDVDPSIFAEKETKINTTYFEMPRIVLGTVLVIIILLILAFRKPKQKVIYVEKK